MLIDFTEEEIKELNTCIRGIEYEYGQSEILTSILEKISTEIQGEVK
jgi:hypothetical protein